MRHEKKKKTRKKKNRRLITFVGVERGTYLTSSIFHEELNVTNCGFGLPPVVLLAKNVTAAERLRLWRSDPGFSLAVTQDGPQFRTQRLGQTSRRYSLSLRTIHSFSAHCAHPLPSLLPIFFIFPSVSPSSVCASLLLSSRLPPHSLPSPFILLHYHNDH